MNALVSDILINIYMIGDHMKHQFEHVGYQTESGVRYKVYKCSCGEVRLVRA